MDQKGGWLIRGKPCLLPVVPARGGAEVALKIYIYKTFLIYRTCMRRAPAKPVRACTLRNWCLVSHVTFQAPLHTSHLTVFTLHTTHFTLHSSHCTLHTAPFAVNTSLHTVLLRLHTSHFTLHTSHFTLHSSQSKLHTSHSTLHTSHCTKQPWRSHSNAICRDWVAKHNRTTCNGVGNCSSKTGSPRQSEKKTILKHFLKGILKGKLLAPKLGKSADKWLSQPGCSHSNTIYNLQLQKTIVLRMQPRRQATLTQPLQCDLQAQIPKHPITTHTQAHPKQLEATVTLRQKKR